MVIDANKQFCSVNRSIVKFIEENETLDAAQRDELIAQWKVASGKLKTSMKREITKKPSRVVSKYLYFCRDERPKIQAENPDLDIKQCTCLLGKAWQKFKDNPDPERMAKYTKLFEEDQQRYNDEKNKDDEPQTTPTKSLKTTYLRYCSKQRAENPKISLKELSVGWAAVKSNPHELALLQQT